MNYRRIPNRNENLTYNPLFLSLVFYSLFYRFMDNLQSEVLEIEFRKFSGGNDTITHAAFAKSLLRFTQIADIEASLQQLNERLTPENSKVRSYPLTSK